MESLDKIINSKDAGILAIKNAGIQLDAEKRLAHQTAINRIDKARRDARVSTAALKGTVAKLKRRNKSVKIANIEAIINAAIK